MYQKDAYEGRQMRFGVREHGMSSVLNGMFAYGGLRPFGATFLNFITYAWGGVRLRYGTRKGQFCFVKDVGVHANAFCVSVSFEEYLEVCGGRDACGMSPNV